MPPQVIAELERVFKTPLIESYGMTEAAHQMASSPLPPGKRIPGSVGIAAGPEVAIMDISGQLLAARARMVWCMVGTAVYQVGLHSFIQPKNLSALKPGVQKIMLPTAMGAKTPAIKPWI